VITWPKGKWAGASARAQAVAGSAFTALINSFFVSLIALIPGTAALGRAWSLMQGRNTPETQPQES
jgi:hypothetical protein